MTASAAAWSAAAHGGRVFRDGVRGCLVGRSHFCRVVRDGVRGRLVGRTHGGRVFRDRVRGCLVGRCHFCRVVRDGVRGRLVGRSDDHAGGIQGLDSLVGGCLLHDARSDQRPDGVGGRSGRG